MCEMIEIYDILNFNKFYKRDAISLERQSRNVPRSDKQHFLVSNFMDTRYTGIISPY